jgi:hypothetical protein
MFCMQSVLLRRSFRLSFCGEGVSHRRALESAPRGSYGSLGMLTQGISPSDASARVSASASLVTASKTDAVSMA